jgi:hypothetical protein
LLGLGKYFIIEMLLTGSIGKQQSRHNQSTIRNGRLATDWPSQGVTFKLLLCNPGAIVTLTGNRKNSTIGMKKAF